MSSEGSVTRGLREHLVAFPLIKMGTATTLNGSPHAAVHAIAEDVAQQAPADFGSAILLVEDGEESLFGVTGGGALEDEGVETGGFPIGGPVTIAVSCYTSHWCGVHVSAKSL